MKLLLELTRESLFLFDLLKSFTNARFEIYTDAQPTLKRAGQERYHQKINFLSSNTLFIILSSYSSSWYFINEGNVNNPKYVGITKRVPNMYQGVLFPHLVFILSLAIPTKGLMIPSAIYPDKKA